MRHANELGEHSLAKVPSMGQPAKEGPHLAQMGMQMPEAGLRLGR